MEIWKRMQNFGKKFGNLETLRIFGTLEKIEIWRKKFGNLNFFWKSGKKLETWKKIWKFGKYLEIWKTFENVEKNWKFGKKKVWKLVRIWKFGNLEKIWKKFGNWKFGENKIESRHTLVVYHGKNLLMLNLLSNYQFLIFQICIFFQISDFFQISNFFFPNFQFSSKIST